MIPTGKSYLNADEEDLAEYVRNETIGVLKKELAKKVSESELLVSQNEKMKNLLDPVNERIGKLNTEVTQHKEYLVKRAAERKRLEEVFFKQEEKIMFDLSVLIGDDIERYRVCTELSYEKIELCNQWINHFQLRNSYENELITLNEAESLHIPLFLYNINANIQNCNMISNKRIHSSSIDHRTSHVEVLKLTLENDLEYFKDVSKSLESELNYAKSYTEQRSKSENVRNLLQNEMIMQRKQKSLQQELEGRKERLEELRNERMKQMQADRDELEAKREREQKRRDKKYIDDLKNSRAVREANQLKKKIANVRDKAVAALLGTEKPIDEEEHRMLDAIGEIGKADMEDKAQGLRNIKITVGDEETEYFHRQMKMLIEKKLPYYTRMAKPLGKKVSIWCQFSYNVSQFVTHMDIGHISSDHPYHRNLTSSGYASIGHPALKFVFWVKGDVMKFTGVSKFDFAFSSSEEERFINTGYEAVGPCLLEFDLPDCTMWVEKVNKVLEKKTRTNISVATNSAIQQLQQTRELMAEHPNNENLRALEEKFMGELESCYRKEESAEVENPLRAAKRLMALDDYELDLWVDVFSQIDTEHSGYITIDQLFNYIDEYVSSTGRLVFTTMNAIDNDGLIDFGNFMNTIGTFCFFGDEELLKFLYNSADKSSLGIIKQSDYIDLLNDLHPYEKSRALKALKVQKIRPTEEIRFDHFVTTNAKFPAVLFPFFKLQNSFRAKILGEKWWKHKLLKYAETRTKLVTEAELLDKKAEAELLAFDENENRKSRMRERARLISQETSAVKLAVLKARQFTDALK